MSKKTLFIVFVTLLTFSKVNAQDPFKGLTSLFTIPENYQVLFTNSTLQIDGHLREAAWDAAPWSKMFVDITGDEKLKPAFETRMKLLWDDSCLYVAAELREPHVWAYFKDHDAIVFHENDFEVFLDPGNSGEHYYEIQINARNTIFDLVLSQPYRDGGKAMPDWNAAGLRTAVSIQGTLNNPADRDQGWTVEMAIPFKALNTYNGALKPGEGDFWRANFSRVQWKTEVTDGGYVRLKDKQGKYLAEDNWVWSAQGVINMHFPERWGYLHFIKSKGTAFTLPYQDKQKPYLWLTYYKQKAYFKNHKKYASSLKELCIETNTFMIDSHKNILETKGDAHQFLSTIEDRNQQIKISLNQQGQISILK
jgi:hypothetical protein